MARQNEFVRLHFQHDCIGSGYHFDPGRHRPRSERSHKVHAIERGLANPKWHGLARWNRSLDVLHRSALDYVWIRRSLPFGRRMLKCEHRLAPSHRDDIYCGRCIWLVSAVGSCVYVCSIPETSENETTNTTNSVVDVNAAITSDLGQPFAAYLIQCMPQKMALAILSLTIIAGFFMGQGCMIAASRVTFAYARDDCFPFSRIWKQVNPITRTPVNAVWANTTIGILMLLLIFGGSVSIGALFSVGAIAAEVAFCTPIFIRVFFVGKKFRPGPWNLGKASIPIGCVACAFVALMIPILNFPSVKGADLE